MNDGALMAQLLLKFGLMEGGYLVFISTSVRLLTGIDGNEFTVLEDVVLHDF
jgi:hypothetical protein